MSCHWTLLHIQWPQWPLICCPTSHQLFCINATRWTYKPWQQNNTQPFQNHKTNISQNQSWLLPVFLAWPQSQQILWRKHHNVDETDLWTQNQHFPTLHCLPPIMGWSLSLWFTPLALQQWHSSHPFILSILTSSLFWQKYCQSMHAGGTTWKQDMTLTHTSHRLLVIWILLCLHPKKACLNSSFTSCPFQPAWLLHDIK